jgi:hypothetical protein
MGYAAAAAAVLGGISGGQKDVTKVTGGSSGYNGHQMIDFDILNKGRSGLEADAYNGQQSGYRDLQSLLGMGPGSNEVKANTQYQNDFAGQLQQMLQKLNNPTSGDIQGNYSKAQQIFAPQQTALNQQFEDQNIQSNRLAARLGRAGNDPILRNKMMQEQTRQQTMLNSQMGSYAASDLPQQQAQNLMQMGGALSNLRQGLASQAFTNRQTLMTMGNQITNAERQYRLGTSSDTHYNDHEDTQASGGGFKGAMSGAMNGASSVMSMGGGTPGGK